jgi:hypothetical protein
MPLQLPGRSPKQYYRHRAELIAATKFGLFQHQPLFLASVLELLLIKKLQIFPGEVLLFQPAAPAPQFLEEQLYTHTP